MLTEGMMISNRYQVLNKIGTGGMSDVYKAKDTILGRNVAIKVLKQEFSDDISFVTKFHTEAQAAAVLEHPNIVNIYDVGSENKMHYIVMEFIEGITLKTYIEKRGKINFGEAASIAIQVANGISAAHNKRIVHRDIKPQNIIISTEGKVKVTDFGIAHAASNNTVTADVMGSVHYTSPEQARNGFVDYKSDIYSLGIVMYEMVTGHVPFTGDTAVSIAIQHLQEDIVPPTQFVPNLPLCFEKIILKCTQKSPDRRYENMEELVADLKNALISPDKDFVVVPPIVSSQDKTKVIGAEELEQIKKETNDTYYNDEEEEEEEEVATGFLNPKIERLITILGIAAAVIIIVVILAIIGHTYHWFGSGTDKTTTEQTDKEKDDTDEPAVDVDSEDVVMIDIVGMDITEAQEKLNELGLGIFVSEMRDDDNFNENEVISQNIEVDNKSVTVEKGDKVAAHSTINVVVCSGEVGIELTNVTGMTEASAMSTLQGDNLSVDTVYNYSDTVASGKVISQNPTAGSIVKEDDTIQINVSRGPEVVSIKVPNVVGMTEIDAKASLKAAKFEYDSTSVNSDKVAKGLVISQSVAAGTELEEGSLVELVISDGVAVKPYKLVEFSLTEPTLTEGEEIDHAEVTITDANGNALADWNGTKVNPGDYTISSTRSYQNTGTAGTCTVVWFVKKDDGEIAQYSTPTTKAVTFTLVQ